MKRFLSAIIFVSWAVISFSSCTKDVADPVGPVDIVEPRTMTQEQIDAENKETLSTLQYLLCAPLINDVVASRKDITDGGRLVGYRIRFRKGGFKSVYLDVLGTGCKYLPVSIKEEGGLHWWTIDGQIYKDSNNNAQSVESSPLFFQSLLGVWYFKYQNNSVYKKYCKAEEYTNLSVVKKVFEEDGQLFFELCDGYRLGCPCQMDKDVYFSGARGVFCMPGYSEAVDYTLVGFDAASTKVSASMEPAGWTASVSNGKVFITAPKSFTAPATLTLSVSDGTTSVTRSAVVQPGNFSVADPGEQPCTAVQKCNLVVTSNVSYSFEIPSEASSWLSYSITTTDDLYNLMLKANAAKDSRSASIAFKDALGAVMATLEIVQCGRGADYFGVTVAEFCAASVAGEDYYILSGVPSAIGADGSMTLTDATGSVSVGAPENYARYAARFTSSTKLYVQGHRSVSGGQPKLVDASIKYFIDHSVHANAGWMELPADEYWNSLEFFHHPMTIDGKVTRNYSFYWDYENLVSQWVAYPLNPWLRSKGGRSDVWGLDPLLPRDKQPVLLNPYSGSNAGFSVDRGHQMPSADRYLYKANVESFYGTNMTPQKSSFNQGFWVGVEESVRGWAYKCDTLYVVTGCTVDDAMGKAYDNDGKKVTVPGHYYKALLAYKKDPSFGHNGYMAIGLWVRQGEDSMPNVGPALSVSILELEALTGHDFFANLPAAVGEEMTDEIEIENPATVSWWW